MRLACSTRLCLSANKCGLLLAAKEKSCALIPDGRYSGLEGLSSWKTSRLDGVFATTVVTTEAIVSSKDNWSDAGPNSVHPNATTTEEIFSTNYSNAEYNEAVAQQIPVQP